MSFVPRPTARRRPLVLADARSATPLVRHLFFRTVDGLPYDHLPGQWVKLYLPQGIERDYSIASAPKGDSLIELVITRVEGGPGSNELHRMEVGTVIDSLGPNGLFVREEDHRSAPALYVATGTGLAPLRAMLEDELSRPSSAPQLLLFGGRHEADLLFRDQLEAWAREGRLRYEPTLSRGETSWTGRRGYVQTHLLELVPTMPGAHVYICGLSRMITDVRAVLRKELGLARTQVHSERYD